MNLEPMGKTKQRRKRNIHKQNRLLAKGVKSKAWKNSRSNFVAFMDGENQRRAKG